MKKLTYTHTFYAACAGYIVQAVVNNLAPLLFILMQEQFGLDRLQITSLITVNFCVQLGVDLASTVFVDRIGYRASAVLAGVFSAVGLSAMSFLPFLLPDAYAGLLTAVVLCALGGGLLEVIISPIVEALPGEGKSGSMSLLHSFYCWGCVGVIALTTGYLALFGRAAWRWLPLAWAAVPVADAVFFLFVPVRSLIAAEEEATPMAKLLKTGMFWVLFALMLCAGAGEQAMSQWASLFAETGLGVSKTLGDLLGPCLFSVLMGSGRAFFGGKGEAIPREKAITASALLAVFSYLLATLSPWPLLSLLGCGLCGLAVAIFWPGVFTLAAQAFPKGGTALFAVLALAGDLGCSFGPGTVGWISAAAGGSLKPGLLTAALFPLGLVILIAAYKKEKKKLPV